MSVDEYLRTEETSSDKREYVDVQFYLANPAEVIGRIALLEEVG